MKRFLVIALVLGLTLSFGSASFAANDDGSAYKANTVSTIGQGTRAPGSLTTIFAGNNGYAGNTFDILPARDLDVTAMDINSDTAGATCLVDVYYIAGGTCVGNEANASAWTLLDSGTGTSAGSDLPTFIDLPGAIGTGFATGSTNGMYMDLASYGTSRINYTNSAGPLTFSNADLTIITNSGQPSPAFSSPFLYRAWNGTLYYDDGAPTPPSVDIECNGEDAGVVIYNGTNCKVDFQVNAGFGAGYPVDIWVGFNHPVFGWMTYDGLGMYLGWNIGLSAAYYTGPLATMGGTCMDFPLGLGAYKAGVGIDGTANGNFNWPLYTMDMVDFTVVAPPQVYSWDDSTTENLLCWSAGGEMCWFSRFTAYAGGETIVDMHCLFGSVMYPNYAPGNGTVTDCYVWNDPTNDGDPTDAALVSTESIVVANVDTDTYNVYPLTNPAVISGEFFVGCNMPHAPSQYCAPIDQSTPYVAGDSFYCGDYSGAPFNPNDLMLNGAPPAEWGNYFCVRAGY
jgi:hypothetical protein